MNTLFLVTARSGSKSVPNKNIRPLGGFPLMAYRIASALQIAPAENVWVSTDSEEYAAIARECGAQVPFLRPAALATDTASTPDTAMHAVKFADDHGYRFDALAILEPTSPFIYPETLKAAVDALEADHEADAIVATRPAKPSTFFIQPARRYLDELAVRVAERGILRRQDEEKQVHPSGGYYITRWSNFQKTGLYYTPKTLSGLVTPLESLEIDDPIEWDWAEFLIQSGKLKPSQYGLR